MAPFPRKAPPDRPASQLALTAFEAHGRELRSFLFRRVGNRHDAHDLSQEVFARLLRIENAELVRKPLAYLLGIAAHVVREFYHRKQHQCVIFNSAVAESVCERPGAGSHLSFGDPEQLELQNQLADALGQLPPTHQAVLLLVKQDGLSYEEAAKASGLSVHTVEKYLVEARARLRVILKDL
jgi:RNA polymerase sigma-70 factor (ECF subfamily)